MAGWRWLFMVEGTPAIVLGVITIFYLTDWPSQARWLLQDEREWLINELQAEVQAKKRIQDPTIMQAFCDRRVPLLIAVWPLSGPFDSRSLLITVDKPQWQPPGETTGQLDGTLRAENGGIEIVPTCTTVAPQMPHSIRNRSA